MKSTPLTLNLPIFDILDKPADCIKQIEKAKRQSSEIMIKVWDILNIDYEWFPSTKWVNINQHNEKLGVESLESRIPALFVQYCDDAHEELKKID